MLKKRISLFQIDVRPYLTMLNPMDAGKKSTCFVLAFLFLKKALPSGFVPDKSETFEGTPNADGRLFISDDANMPSNGYLPLGKKYAGKRIMARFDFNVNLGVTLNFFLKSNPALPIRTLYFDPLNDDLQSLDTGLNPSHNIAWAEIHLWSRGYTLNPKPAGPNVCILKSNKHGQVTLLNQGPESKLKKGILSAGPKGKLKPIAVGHDFDPNLGEMIKLYACTPAGKPTARVLNAYFEKDGKLVSMLTSKAQHRTLAWMDFELWLSTDPDKRARFKELREGPNQYFYGHVKPNGQLEFKKDDSLLNGGIIPFGKFVGAGAKVLAAGKDVVGTFTEDPVHGKMPVWYFKGEDNKPAGDPICQHFHKNNGNKIGVLRDQKKQSRDFFWIDIYRWATEKALPEKLGHLPGRFYRTILDPDGGVLIGSDESTGGKIYFAVGYEYRNQPVYIRVHSDTVHGRVLLCHTEDPDTKLPSPEPINIIRKGAKGKLISINQGAVEKRSLGWMDMELWMRKKKTGRSLAKAGARRDALGYGLVTSGQIKVASGSHLLNQGAIPVGINLEGQSLAFLLARKPDRELVAAFYHHHPLGEPYGLPVVIARKTAGKIHRDTAIPDDLKGIVNAEGILRPTILDGITVFYDFDFGVSQAGESLVGTFNAHDPTFDASVIWKDKKGVPAASSFILDHKTYTLGNQPLATADACLWLHKNPAWQKRFKIPRQDDSAYIKRKVLNGSIFLGSAIFPPAELIQYGVLSFPKGLNGETLVGYFSGKGDQLTMRWSQANESGEVVSRNPLKIFYIRDGKLQSIP